MKNGLRAQTDDLKICSGGTVFCNSIFSNKYQTSIIILLLLHLSGMNLYLNNSYFCEAFLLENSKEIGRTRYSRPTTDTSTNTTIGSLNKIITTLEKPISSLPPGHISQINTFLRAARQTSVPIMVSQTLTIYRLSQVGSLYGSSYVHSFTYSRNDKNDYTFIVNAPYQHGIIMVVDELFLSDGITLWNNRTCLDFIQVTILNAHDYDNDNKTIPKICGRVKHSDKEAKPIGLIGYRTLISPLGHMAVRVKYNQVPNAFPHGRLVFTAYRNYTSGPENCKDAVCSLETSVVYITSTPTICISKSLLCDGYFNCGNLSTSFDYDELCPSKTLVKSTSNVITETVPYVVPFTYNNNISSYKNPSNFYNPLPAPKINGSSSVSSTKNVKSVPEPPSNLWRYLILLALVVFCGFCYKKKSRESISEQREEPPSEINGQLFVTFIRQRLQESSVPIGEVPTEDIPPSYEESVNVGTESLPPPYHSC